MESTGMKLMREGILQGREEGREEERVRLLTSQLRARFSPLPQGLAARIAGASTETVERWALRLLDAKSLDEVFRD